jgi:hypothetical protein
MALGTNVVTGLRYVKLHTPEPSLNRSENCSGSKVKK